MCNFKNYKCITNAVKIFCGLKELRILNGYGVMTKMPIMYNTCVIKICDFKKLAFTSLLCKPLIRIAFEWLRRSRIKDSQILWQKLTTCNQCAIKKSP